MHKGWWWCSCLLTHILVTTSLAAKARRSPEHRARRGIPVNDTNFSRHDSDYLEDSANSLRLVCCCCCCCYVVTNKQPILKYRNNKMLNARAQRGSRKNTTPKLLRSPHHTTPHHIPIHLHTTPHPHSPPHHTTPHPHSSPQHTHHTMLISCSTQHGTISHHTIHHITSLAYQVCTTTLLGLDCSTGHQLKAPQRTPLSNS
ncbi:hypothetical protein E2C01_008426 [Portunus trituberculatus]|uniref:Uncharacterized protein n=1 Tax=Portunus trituberculatus TaxID=210409 RepID=A0A5B7D0T2_PORTR|nr:hypothetical protein [Portunus trituberculatus]